VQNSALGVHILGTIVGNIMHLLPGCYIVFVWVEVIGLIASTDSELLIENNLTGILNLFV